MPWMLLMPSELDEVVRARAKPLTNNAAILATLQRDVDRITGDLTLTAVGLAAVRQAAGRWQDGGTSAFKAVLAAIDRHDP